MITTIRSLAYLVASLLFILSLRGLSTQETARRGNRLRRHRHADRGRDHGAGAARPRRPVATMPDARLDPGRRAGAARSASAASIGAFLAARVAMTSMPELVAMLHSFVGAAAVLVGIATYLQPGDAYAGRTAPRTWSRSTSACWSAR